MVKYNFNGFTPRRDEDKGERVVYLHRRKDNGQPFYIGYGDVRRSRDEWDRSDKWKSIRDEAGGRTVEYLVENASQAMVKRMEGWCIPIYRNMIGFDKMANKNDGGGGRNAGEYVGEESASFQGYLRLYNSEMRVQVILGGQKEMRDNGFHHTNLYDVKNGKVNSVGSKFYADENGYRIQFQVVGPFATREEAVIDGYSFAEKNATNAKANYSELNVGKALGTLNGRFKGYKFGVNQKTKKIVMTVGAKDTIAQGFDQGNVDSNIRGNPKVKHVKGFIFTRIDDPEELIELCSNYLEDGYEFHHELSEQNFMMLCEME